MIILTDGHLRQLNQLIGCSPLERKVHVMMITIERSAPEQVVQINKIKDIFLCLILSAFSHHINALSF